MLATTYAVQHRLVDFPLQEWTEYAGVAIVGKDSESNIGTVSPQKYSTGTLFILSHQNHISCQRRVQDHQRLVVLSADSVIHNRSVRLYLRNLPSIGTLRRAIERNISGRLSMFVPTVLFRISC